MAMNLGLLLLACQSHPGYNSWSNSHRISILLGTPMVLKVEKGRNERIFEIEWDGDLEEAGRNVGKNLVHKTLE